MLDDLTHDQLFTQLIIEQMNTYCDKCANWYRGQSNEFICTSTKLIILALVTRAQSNTKGSRLKAAALLAENPELIELLTDIWGGPEKMQECLERVSST